MIFSTIRKMAAGILPESLIVLYHGERPRRKTAKKHRSIRSGVFRPCYVIIQQG